MLQVVSFSYAVLGTLTFNSLHRVSVCSVTSDTTVTDGRGISQLLMFLRVRVALPQSVRHSAAKLLIEGCFVFAALSPT